MKRAICLLLLSLLTVAVPGLVGQAKKSRPLNVSPQHISNDAAVKYDYDIVYVRAPRVGDDKQIAWAEVFAPLRAEPGSDLMLLHPDGTEEVLVAVGDDAIADPFVSFDGESVSYTPIPPHSSSRHASSPQPPQPLDVTAVQKIRTALDTCIGEEGAVSSEREVARSAIRLTLEERGYLQYRRTIPPPIYRQ